MTTTVKGKISQHLLDKVRSAGSGDENHTIAWAVAKSLGPAKSVFDRETMTVTIELEDNQFVSEAIEKGLAA